MLDLKGRLTVVVGGGNVAVRKVRGLLDSGADRICVVSPSFHPDLPQSVDRINDSYHRKHLIGAALVFASTDSAETNDAVVRDARAIGALVCRADGDEDNAGDFATPAMLREGPVLVAVSSGGSPALSAKMRDVIRHSIDPDWVQMAQAMQILRPAIRKSVAPPQRPEVFHKLASDEAVRELCDHGIDGLKAWLSRQYPEFNA